MNSTQLSSSAAAHHVLAVHQVVLLLETDLHRGLTAEEAAVRLDRYGPNAFEAAARRGLLSRVGEQVRHPLIYVLIAAGVITAALGEYIDSVVIFGVVLVNVLVGVIQESKAEAALDSLRALVHTQARVMRGGQPLTVPSKDLVPGDVVLLDAGDKVPADLRLIRMADLQVDESTLTGESVPVVKDEVVLAEATPVADRRNMVYSGTLVTAGHGAGIVVATGAETELGEIHRLVGSAQTLDTPLTVKLARFSKVLTVFILAMAAVTFGIGLVRGQDAVQTFTAAIALAVGAIPEGLPAAVTITLAIGVARMAKRRAVVRRLPVVETLGSTTVICSDKTGTLTENRMTVRAVWTPDRAFQLTDSAAGQGGPLVDAGGAAMTAPFDQALRWCLVAGTGCNDATITRQDGAWEWSGDPTEGALLAVAANAGIDPVEIAQAYPREATIPFSSDRQYMATLHRHPSSGDHVVLVKGAIERVLPLCTTQMDAVGARQPLNAAAALTAAEDLAGRGLRVLATAVNPSADPDAFREDGLHHLVFAGLQAMHDPPRAAAAAAVRACRTAGIDVKMITGDHAATAAAIAGRLGLLDEPTDGHLLTGENLRRLSAEEWPDAVNNARVFARVSPEQKLRLVEALQARGHVVAMTGDGVNDAPALRQANVGVAMGCGGTEVAKDAADMVLTDDDFATIEAGVEEGRGVFDNLTKFIVWTLPTNMGEGLVILTAILLGATLPILPTQILWINMTTAVALGLMLAFEPKEPGIMNRPPRDPRRPLLTGALVARILLVSALLVGGAWWLFAWESSNGATVEQARTAAVNLFVLVETFYLFSCRSLTHSMWHVGPLSNRWIIVGVTAQLLGQLALTYLPGMNQLFQTAPITLEAWLRILGVAALTSLVVATDKYLRRRMTEPIRGTDVTGERETWARGPVRPATR